MKKETMGWQWHQLDIMQSFATHTRKTTVPAPHYSIFYRPDDLPVKTLKATALKAMYNSSFTGKDK